MNDLNSVPASVEERIAEANRLLSNSSQAAIDGYREAALIKVREGMVVIQQVSAISPEHGTLLLAGIMGRNGFEIQETEVTQSVHIAQRKFLGKDIGTKYTPVETRRTYSRLVKFI